MTYWGNPGKSGHLCNQDTFGGPQGVRIIQVPLYTCTFWWKGGAIRTHPPTSDKTPRFYHASIMPEPCAPEYNMWQSHIWCNDAIGWCNVHSIYVYSIIVLYYTPYMYAYNYDTTTTTKRNHRLYTRSQRKHRDPMKHADEFPTCT
jgi:hypothetical protein